MNTNNALERIELGGGWYFKLADQKSQLYKLISADNYFFGMWNLTDASKFAAAMQPQVSASDEAVAREICEAVRNNSSNSDYFGVSVHDEAISEVSAIIARHRQPAAVSADAVEFLDELTDKVANAAHGLYQGTKSCRDFRLESRSAIQAAIDACHLDGARKYRDAMREKLVQRMGNEEYGHAKAAVSLDIEELDALSPETVCGGGNHGQR